MSTDYHIFTSAGEQVFTVRQTGIEEDRDFSSLSEATRHLRDQARAEGGWVVIHDEEGNPNRIPLPLLPPGVASVLGSGPVATP